MYNTAEWIYGREMNAFLFSVFRYLLFSIFCDLAWCNNGVSDLKHLTDFLKFKSKVVPPTDYATSRRAPLVCRCAEIDSVIHFFNENDLNDVNNTIHIVCVSCVNTYLN